MQSQKQSQKRVSIREQPQWLRAGILLGNRFHFRHQHPSHHNRLNLSLLLSILLGAGGLAYLGTQLPPLVFIPLGAFGFGLIYFMLFILVVHEASHQMFIVLKNLQQARRWNRLLGWMVCIPFGVEYVKHWEIGHSIHHLHPTTSADPQNCAETIYTGKPLFQKLAKDLLIPGYALLRIGHRCPAEQEYGSNRQLMMGAIGVWAVWLSLTTLYLSWAVAIASLLGLQILVGLNTLKITMEHGGKLGQQ
ncbi:MAG: hypothetical protein F6K19_40905, partial [Cyanothece sp. SIO1E1]|nr:hypothetical protein [Cyanothece sp. SIO1E1]